MQTLPAGTVTFLLTDIENSASQWEEAPGEMEAVLGAHDAAVEEIVSRYGGSVFKHMGDGCWASFPSAPAAASAAIDVQRRIQGQPDHIRARPEQDCRRTDEQDQPQPPAWAVSEAASHQRQPSADDHPYLGAVVPLVRDRSVLFAIGSGALVVLGDGRTATGEDDTGLLNGLAWPAWMEKANQQPTDSRVCMCGAPRHMPHAPPGPSVLLCP